MTTARAPGRYELVLDGHRRAAAEREAARARERSGELVVRRATGDELRQLRADRDRFLAECAEAAEASERKAAKLRAAMPPAPDPKPKRRPGVVREQPPAPKPEPKPQRTCPICGMEFEAKRSRGGHDQKYCGRACSNKVRSKQAHAKAA